MKFINSPFAILDKRLNALDYQKRNLLNKDFWKREKIINAFSINLSNK